MRRKVCTFTYISDAEEAQNSTFSVEFVSPRRGYIINFFLEQSTSMLPSSSTVETRRQVIGRSSYLFWHIWSKSLLHGIWDENMREVLMKMMCSNHYNTLLKPLKLPSCNSESVKEVRDVDVPKFIWSDPQRTTWVRSSGLTWLYGGLDRTWGKFLVGIKPCSKLPAGTDWLLCCSRFPAK